MVEGLTASLGSAILGHLLDLWMPPSNTGGYWKYTPSGGFNRFPLDKLTTSPGGFVPAVLGLRVLPYNTVKVTLSVLADLGGLLGRVKGQGG